MKIDQNIKVMQNNQYTKNITPAFVFGITLDFSRIVAIMEITV